MEKLARILARPQRRVPDFRTDALHFQCQEIFRKAGNERRPSCLCDGQVLRIFFQQAVRLHSAPAAVQEKDALPLTKTGQKLIDDVFIVACAGADDDGIGIVHRFLHRLGHRHVEGALHHARHADRFRRPCSKFLLASDVDKGRNVL